MDFDEIYWDKKSEKIWNLRGFYYLCSPLNKGIYLKK